MRKVESLWRRRRRGINYIATAVGMFGFFLVLAGISSPGWTRVFAVLAFASLILCMRKGITLWELDEVVFEPDAFGPTARRPRADTPSNRSRDRALSGFRPGSATARARRAERTRPPLRNGSGRVTGRVKTEGGS